MHHRGNEECSDRRNLILLATYWNERDWIRPSLAQIERINPLEIIICDGCFDPTVPPESTDGTRELIGEFVHARPNATLVEAQRVGLAEAVHRMLRGHGHASFHRNRYKAVLKTVLSNPYRRNQALTFHHMINRSRYWDRGLWFMTYDCDQFYPDELWERFDQVEDDPSIGLLTAKELTFFESFELCTAGYESRQHNNMPHRIYADTTIIPTRDPVREGLHRRRPGDLNGFWSRHRYPNQVDAMEAGHYCHYKLRRPERLASGYALGDRRRPDFTAFAMRPYEGEHPPEIREFFGEDPAFPGQGV